ncbi:hypothetical protein LCGC14_0428940 [marine sediment metagenome]|uniref:Uncharacterized protein n=1 Tax=marine sediment metagenome TaxID=412755 RepID=A0A0F9VAN2_9ZZZZ
MFPADHKHTPVSVEYDCQGGRRSRTFDYPHKAKRFYVSKSRLGKNPTIKRSDTMATTKKTAKKKATPKKKSVKKTPGKKEGLSKMQVRILTALKGTSIGGKEVTREQLRSKMRIDAETKIGWSKLLGAATREGDGVQGGGLLGMGFIKSTKNEGSRVLVYAITASGQKAAEASSK